MKSRARTRVIESKVARMAEATAPRVRCETCPRGCLLAEGAVGACGARRNVGGQVRASNYGRLTSMALDPVEKKPFACWQRGRYLLSVGSYGCNLHCPFCQNHRISQAGEDELAWHYVAPEQLVAQALELAPRGCVGIAYTYNEPLVGWEYVADCASEAHAAGLKNAVVSNGMVQPELFARLLPHIDAINIDLKAFNGAFYRRCGFDGLDCVKANIEQALACPTCHVEVTTLFVPGMSSSSDVLEAATWPRPLPRRSCALCFRGSVNT